MNYISAASLVDFYYNLDVFLVVLVRFLGLIIILPIFSGQNIPMILRILIAVSLSAMVMSSGQVRYAAYSEDMFGYFLILATEFITGFIIGFVVYFIFSVFYFVGQLVDYQLGYSMVSVFDPISQLQVPITGNLYYLMIMLFFLIGRGLDYFIEVLFDSFATIPLGYANHILDTNIVWYMIVILTSYMTLGVQIALPVIGTIIIIDVALGLLVKAVPQMNVFVVGMPIKIFVGLIVVYLIMPMLWESYKVVAAKAAEYVEIIVKGMAPQ